MTKKIFSDKDVVGRVRIDIHIAHAHATLKAEITIVHAMLARGPIKRRGGGGWERIEEPAMLTEDLT